MRPRPPGTLLALLLLLAPGLAPAAGAGEPLGHSGMLGPYPMEREASGTSWQPEAAGMDGVHLWAGPWRVMLHAWAFGLVTRQGGPRGGHEGFSTNMAMAAASRTLAGGTFTARAMVSLEPLMGPDGYRLLLQTGETGNGRTNLIDRQHPHDLFMEMAVAWSHPIRGRGSVFAYAGWPGEPAVGPPVFMHRASGAEIPVAPIAHHWLDATHISFGTATAGLVWGRAKLEASAFNGHEPDARRWNLERPRFDASAARLTINPWPCLSAQLSAAQLRSPERLHQGIDVRRYTASLAYGAAGGRLRPEVTLAWGRNVRSATVPAACPLGATASDLVATCFARPPFAPSRVLDSLMAEATVHAGARHTVFARAEHVDKDELFPLSDPLHNRVFPVGSLLAGYRYDLPLAGHVRWGLGAAGAVALVPEFLAADYGRRPLSGWVFAAAALR